MPVNDEAVFWTRIRESEQGCWIWLGTVTKDGYGIFTMAGRDHRAHRFAYEALIAEIPDGLVIDHLCRVRLCVNPWHMEPVTNAVNVQRGQSPSALAAKVTHCPQGHPYEGDNVGTNRRPGWRACRTCRAAASRARYHANAEQLRADARARQARYRAEAKAQQQQAG